MRDKPQMPKSHIPNPYNNSSYCALCNHEFEKGEDRAKALGEYDVCISCSKKVPSVH